MNIALLDTPVMERVGRSDGRVLALAAMLGALLFVPSAVRYITSASSLAIGLLLACAIVFGMVLTGVVKMGPERNLSNRITIFALAGAVIAGHFFVAMMGYHVDIGRAVFSLAPLVILVATAFVVERTIFAEGAPLATALRLMRIAFVVMAIGGIIGIQPPSSVIYGRPVFPFSEPSHFALTFAPILIDACVRATRLGRVLWLATSFALAFFLQSLSLVVAATVAGIACLPIWQGVMVSLAAFLASNSVDLGYYTDRLDISDTSQNLSSLVYRQGWEEIWECLKFSRGWGVGFQQLGNAPVYLPTSDRIYTLLGQDLNLADGSFLAAKIMAEFGVIGICVVLAFLVLMVRNLLRLRRHAVGSVTMSSDMLFASSVIVAASVELFVRGVGYFSGTTTLVIAALLAIGRARRRPSASAA